MIATYHSSRGVGCTADSDIPTSALKVKDLEMLRFHHGNESPKVTPHIYYYPYSTYKDSGGAFLKYWGRC